MIILLSDGADNASKLTLTQAISAAHAANAAVYTIGIEGEGFTSAPLEQLSSRNRRPVLRCFLDGGAEVGVRDDR